MQRESCEVRARKDGWGLGTRQWRFVAEDDAGRSMASSERFRSGLWVAYEDHRSRRALRDLLHALTLDGWDDRGASRTTSRGRWWYNHRLYRDAAR
jgi:hypothetical protein